MYKVSYEGNAKRFKNFETTIKPKLKFWNVIYLNFQNNEKELTNILCSDIESVKDYVCHHFEVHSFIKITPNTN